MEWHHFLRINYPGGRKVCTAPQHEGPRWLPWSYFPVAKWHYSRVPQSLDSCCRTCKRIRARVTEGIKRHGKPMRSLDESIAARRVLPDRVLTRNERTRRWQQSHPGYNRERNRQYRARLKASRYVDPRPFGEWLRDFMQRTTGIERIEHRAVHAFDELHDNGRANSSNFEVSVRKRWTYCGISAAVGLDEKGDLLRNIVAGRKKPIDIAIVDNVLVLCGEPHMVRVLYPLDY